jgi:hypothetical protein
MTKRSGTEAVTAVNTIDQAVNSPIREYRPLQPSYLDTQSPQLTFHYRSGQSHNRTEAMGRKPNQLILEFFDRGQKLEDASNRYQHTCKSCGEKFPKGRIDSLTAHLVKKCPAISLRDRQKALLQLNDLPDLPENRARNGEAASGQPAPLELPMGNRNWTALETLAEVSRQIDLSEKGDDRGTQNRSAGARSRTEEGPRVERFELQEQWTPDNPPLSYEARVQRDKKRKFDFQLKD